MSAAANDDILARRDRIRRWVKLGQRTGYALFGVALVVFFIGFAAGFDPPVTTIVVGAIIVGSVVLLPATVVHYGIRAADREDRRAGRLD